jgi:Ca2+-binding RTX toxin-like protein
MTGRPIPTSMISRTTTIALSLLLMIPTIVGTVNVWADNFFGTSGPDTITGTNNDDNIFGQGGNDNLRGRGGDDYIEGNDGNDRIRDGLGSDNVWAGSGDDRITLDGIGEEGSVDNNDRPGFDEVHGQAGRDIFNVIDDSVGYLLIYGGDQDDNITATAAGSHGRIYGDAGNDHIRSCCDADYDVWGGLGDDDIEGSSECAISNAYGGPGNDRISSPNDFTSGGDGNDIIEFADCGGVAYGDAGNDQIRGGEVRVELHGGSRDDILRGSDSGDPDKLFGDDGNDRLTGGEGATSFSCGPGTDTITNFDASKGDTKTADCESF